MSVNGLHIVSLYILQRICDGDSPLEAQCNQVYDVNVHRYDKASWFLIPERKIVSSILLQHEPDAP